MQTSPLNVLGTDPRKYMAGEHTDTFIVRDIIRSYGCTPRLEGDAVLLARAELQSEEQRIGEMCGGQSNPKVFNTLLETYEEKECKNSERALTQVADFYVMNHLWFWSGAGQEAYGYKLTDTSVLIPTGIRNKLDGEFKVSALKLGYSMADALDRAIRRELLHGVHPDCDNNGLGSGYRMTADYEQWSKSFTNENPSQFNPYTCSLTAAKKLFTEQPWHNGYGGEAWGTAIDSLQELCKTLNKDNLNLPKLVTQIDSILDQQHNTGILLNNTEFDGVTTAFLDRRAKCKDLGKMVPLCSDTVAGLVKKVNRYFGLTLETDKEEFVNLTVKNGNDHYEIFAPSNEVSTLISAVTGDLTQSKRNAGLNCCGGKTFSFNGAVVGGLYRRTEAQYIEFKDRLDFRVEREALRSSKLRKNNCSVVTIVVDNIERCVDVNIYGIEAEKLGLVESPRQKAKQTQNYVEPIR